MPTLTKLAGLSLEPLHALLIQKAYPDYAEIILEREFGGGYSGTRIFAVVPVRPGGARDARMVTKVGPADALRHERDNYTRYVAGALPFSAAQVREFEAQEGQGALNYVFVGGGPLGQTVTLEEYYLAHAADEVKRTLSDLWRQALGQSWYSQAGPLNVPFRAEYGRHLLGVDLDAIVRAVFPRLSPAEGEQVKIPGVSGVYPNPLKIYPRLLDTLLEGRRSFVHGDLHLRNVLVEESSGRAWLIDFAKVQERHNLFDFIKLEVYLRLMGLAAEYGAFSLNEYMQFEQALNAAAVDREADSPPNACLSKAYHVIRSIRELARDYMRDGHNFKNEYLTALFLYCLAMLKYHPSNGAVPTQLVFLTACTIAESLRMANEQPARTISSEVNRALQPSRLQQTRIAALEKQLTALRQDHEAASNQLSKTLSEVDRARLKRQLESLEREMAELESKLSIS